MHSAFNLRHIRQPRNSSIGKEAQMRIQLAVAFRLALRSYLRQSVWRIANARRAPMGGDSFKRNAAAQPLTPSLINC